MAYLLIAAVACVSALLIYLFPAAMNCIGVMFNSEQQAERNNSFAKITGIYTLFAATLMTLMYWIANTGIAMQNQTVGLAPSVGGAVLGMVCMVLTMILIFVSFVYFKTVFRWLPAY